VQEDIIMTYWKRNLHDAQGKSGPHLEEVHTPLKLQYKLRAQQECTQNKEPNWVDRIAVICKTEPAQAMLFWGVVSPLVTCILRE
jgi:hypothetical protein